MVDKEQIVNRAERRRIREESLEILRRNGGDRYPGALSLLGLNYAEQGQPGRALDIYDEALVAACRLGDRREEAEILVRMGNARGVLGETDVAIRLYEQALAMAVGLADQRIEGLALGNLGRTHAELGDGGRARAFFDRTLVQRFQGSNHISRPR